MSIKVIISLILFIFSCIGSFALAGMIIFTVVYQSSELTLLIAVDCAITIVCFFGAFLLLLTEKGERNKSVNSINNKSKAQLNSSYCNSLKNYCENTASINSLNTTKWDLLEEINEHLDLSDIQKEDFCNWDSSSQDKYLAMTYAYNLGYDSGYDSGYSAGYNAGYNAGHMFR